MATKHKKFKGPIASINDPKTPGAVAVVVNTDRNAASLEVPLGALYMVTDQPVGKDNLTFVSLLGESAPRVTDGYGGWTTVSRPRNTALIEWTGKNPLLIEIPFFLDNFAIGETHGVGIDTENQIEALETMAGVGRDGEPPLLRWYANAPHDSDTDKKKRWVIEGIEWGDSLRNSAGNRVRQAGTISLREWVGDEFISAAAHNRKKKTAAGRKHPSTYKVKAGDTLQKIAKSKLGSSNRWPEIQKLNPKIRTPGHLKKGTTIKIP